MRGSLQKRREAVVREHMEAENAHDFDRCIAAFDHPRYEIMATGEVWDGHSGVSALLHENKRGFSDFHFQPKTWHHADSSVIVEGRFTGTHDGSWRGLPATLRKVDFPLIIVFVFEGERMVCERTYFDIGTPLTQLGVARDPNSRAGRIAAAANHPIIVGRAMIRSALRRQGPVLVKLGTEIESPQTGERLIFRSTADSSNGELFRAELIMSPVGYMPRRHFHPSQEERFVVLEGRFGYWIGDRTGVADAGETLVCPIGVSHTQWNAGDSIARIYYEHRPALTSAEVFFETYFGLSREGRLAPNGDMRLLQAVVLLQEVGDFIRISSPSPLLQRFLFPPLAVLGRVAGYRARYERFTA